MSARVAATIDDDPHCFDVPMAAFSTPVNERLKTNWKRVRASQREESSLPSVYIEAQTTAALAASVTHKVQLPRINPRTLALIPNEFVTATAKTVHASPAARSDIVRQAALVLEHRALFAAKLSETYHHAQVQFTLESGATEFHVVSTRSMAMRYALPMVTIGVGARKRYTLEEALVTLVLFGRYPTHSDQSVVRICGCTVCVRVDHLEFGWLSHGREACFKYVKRRCEHEPPCLRPAVALNAICLRFGCPLPAEPRARPAMSEDVLYPLMFEELNVRYPGVFPTVAQVVATLPRWNELPEKHAELCELRAAARGKVLHRWRREFVRAMLLDEVCEYEIADDAIDAQVEHVLTRYYARMSGVADDVEARVIVKQTFMSARQAATANEKRLARRATYERDRKDRILVARGLPLPKRSRNDDGEAAADAAASEAAGSEAPQE